ncbi:unnamed protein product [Rotaria sordida]|uniref:MIF4G domain-containing protein n=1 Tax=Rotaria sordida TaxID=392033 RepID=A0A815K2M1_9BILA|nr:unnamed protein product [Rotaria sordida]
MCIKCFNCIAFDAQNVGQTASMAPDYSKAVQAAEKILGLLNRKQSIDNDSSDDDEILKFNGNFEFANVHFIYPNRPESVILREFTVKIRADQQVALVGASGCGKSTTIQLIERFYDTNLVDSNDIRSLNLQWYRSQNKMSKSQATCVCSQSSSSRHRSPSESSRRKKSCKQPRRTSIPSPLQPTSIKSSCADGLYKPPAKLRLVQTSLTDSSTIEYQRLEWESLKKTIIGRLNKVNTSNLPLIISELFQYNIVRGRGLFARGIIEAQIASPFYTPVYAALVSVINSKIPQIGDLVVKQLISLFHQSYQRNDKTNCLTITRFIAHLLNRNVLHAIAVLEMLVSLLRNPSDDSVELAIELIKECGQKLSQGYPRILDSFFSTLKNLLHESSLDKRTLNMIEVLFAIRIDQFKANPPIPSGLDLVDEDDQYKHTISLHDPGELEPMLDVFQYDEQFWMKLMLMKMNQVPVHQIMMKKKNKMIEYKVNENQQSISDQINTNFLALFRTMFLTIDLNHSAEKCTHTTSSSRVYIKSLFLELVKSLGGFNELNNCLTDPTLTEYFQGLFPRDNPKNTKFSINFFASIGLDGLTNEL